jgi:putative hydrolase of the HAD superfamily
LDLDDTLVHQEAMVENAFVLACNQAQDRYGVAPDKLREAVRAHARDLWHHSPAPELAIALGMSSWEGLWSTFPGSDDVLEPLRGWRRTYQARSWADALAELGVQDAEGAAELASLFAGGTFNTRDTVFPDAEPALAELSRGFALVLLTNGPSDLQRHKLTQSGLEPYFSEVAISAELSLGKPNPAVFEAALRSLGGIEAAAAMVGDNRERDVLGAMNAGIRSVWIDRPTGPHCEGPQADLTVRSLGELARLLEAVPV